MLFQRQKETIREKSYQKKRSLCSVTAIVLVFFMALVFNTLHATIRNHEDLIVKRPTQSHLDSASSDSKTIKDQLDQYKTLMQEELQKTISRNDKAYEQLQKRFDVHHKQERISKLRIIQKVQEVRKFTLQNFLLILGIGFIFVFLSLIFLFRRRKKKEDLKTSAAMYRARFHAIEKEKLRFSREIHDGLQGTLSMIHLMSNREMIHAPTNENLRTVSSLSKKAMNSSSGMSKDLYPSDINVQGLAFSLNAFVERMNEIQEKTRFFCNVPTIDYTPEIGIALYRISEELITNTLRHADATEAHLDIKIKNRGIDFIFYDNGVGMELNTIFFGVGVTSIEERVHAIGGKFLIASRKNQGVRVEIKVRGRF